jgi:hypothetical protein
VNVAGGVEVVGDLRVFGSTQFELGYDVFSDRRLKENIVSIEGALDKVTALRGVYFNWAHDPDEDQSQDQGQDQSQDQDEQEAHDSNRSQTKKRITSLLDELRKNKQKETGRQIGVIAQEVQKVLPEIVRKHSGESSENEGQEEKDSPLLTVDYAGMIPVIIESVHDLKNATQAVRDQCRLKKALSKQEEDVQIEMEAAKLREELMVVKKRNLELKNTLFAMMDELKLLKATV